MSLKRITDSVYAFRFIHLLNMDWNKTEAYKNGIIDEKGKLIKKPKTSKEKDSYTAFHRLVFNVRKAIGDSKLSGFASSLYLLSEKYDIQLDIQSKHSGPSMESGLRMTKKPIYWDNELIEKDTPVVINEEVGEIYGEKIYECEQYGGKTIYLSGSQLNEETNAGAIAITDNLLFDQKRVNKRTQVDYNYLRKFQPGFYTVESFNRLLTESSRDKYIAESLKAGQSVILESEQAKRVILFSHDI